MHLSTHPGMGKRHNREEAEDPCYSIFRAVPYRSKPLETLPPCVLFYMEPTYQLGDFLDQGPMWVSFLARKRAGTGTGIGTGTGRWLQIEDDCLLLSHAEDLWLHLRGFAGHGGQADCVESFDPLRQLTFCHPWEYL